MDLYHSSENAIGGTCSLTPPWEEGGRGKNAGQPTVVFSGSSSVGQLGELPHAVSRLTASSAIQLLKFSGFSQIITTASIRNTDFLKTVGATHVLDRPLSPEALHAEIRKITDKPFTTIYDAASTTEPRELGYDRLAPGGILATVQPQPFPLEKLVSDKKVFSVYGDLNLPPNRKLGVSLFSKLTELLAEGALKVRLACVRACAD